VGSLGVKEVILVALAGCGTDLVQTDDPPSAPYRDVVELFDTGIARTCSLNNGVCHNSNSYPDLHTVEALVATVGGTCNADTADRALVNNVCEPAADHLVIPSAAVDVRIVSAALLPTEVDADVRDLTRVTLTVDPPPAGLTPGATDTEVHRGATVFAVGDFGAKVVSVTGAEVVLDLRAPSGSISTKQFFDVRVFPPGPLRLHEGDPNHDGIEGAQVSPMRLVEVGDPEHSYLVKRLVDTSFGELMPRQCRTWDDAANQALVCWVTGLVADGDGKVTNAYAPIDYSLCSMRVAGLGKCR
jgi:hypothetical protein